MTELANDDFDFALFCPTVLEFKSALGWTKTYRIIRRQVPRIAIGQLGNHSTLVVQSGVGREQSQLSFQQINREFQFAAVLSVGICGSLSDKAPVGSVIIPESVVNEEHGEVQTSQVLEFSSRYHEILLTSEQPILDHEDRQAWNERTGAIAVDLESYHLGKISIENNLNFQVVRVVSDDLQSQLPEWIPELLQSNGQINWQALLRRGVINPSSVLRLVSVRKQCNFSLEALGKMMLNT